MTDATKLPPLPDPYPTAKEITVDMEQTDSEAPLTAKDEEIIHRASAGPRILKGVKSAERVIDLSMLPAEAAARRGLPAAILAVKNHTGAAMARVSFIAHTTKPQALLTVSHQGTATCWTVRLPRPPTAAEYTAVRSWRDDKVWAERDSMRANQAQSNAAAYQRHTNAHPQLSEAYDKTIEGIAEDIRSQACTYGAGAISSSSFDRSLEKMRRLALGYGISTSGLKSYKRIDDDLMRIAQEALSLPPGQPRTVSGGPAALHNLPRDPNQAMIDRDGPPKARAPAALLSQPGPAPTKPTPPLPVADITRTGTHFGRWGAGL